MNDEELAGLYPDIDGLQRRTPEAGDRVEWRGRPGETGPVDGDLGTVIIVSGAGSVTVRFDSGALGTSLTQKFSPLTAPDGTVLKGTAAAAADVRCRGCGTILTPASVKGRWIDGHGFMVCVPSPLAGIGHGQRPDYVFHQPMPAGLDGGPEEGNPGA